MRAMEYLDGSVSLVERAIPSPRTDETLLRVSRVGVCGTDLGAVQRKNPRFTDGIVIGHELVGVRDADGGRFTVIPLLTCGRCVQCEAGAENLCEARTIVGAHLDGVLSDFVALPTERLIELPTDVSDAQAALIEPMATALHAWRRADPRPAWRIGVIGAGAIGLCVAAIARAEGHACVVAELDPAKHAAARKLADEVRIELSDSYDAVFDMVGLPATRGQAVASTRPGRPTVLVGLHSSEMSLNGSDIVARERTLLGSFAYTRRDFVDAIDYVRTIDASWTTPVTPDDAVDLINGTVSPDAGVTKLHVIFD